jgi:protein gp37
MAENSGIAWTTNTFNPWVGCTKVGPGCDHCYAEAWNVRFSADGLPPNWGPGAPRRRTAAANWNKVRKWDAAARTSPEPVRVFCASLADVFDNEADPAVRTDLWALVRQCSALEFQFVTKRIGNVVKMLPADWSASFGHCGIIATVVTQAECDRDLPKLIAAKEAAGIAWVGLSIEPQIERVIPRGPAGLDWAITGGESKQRGADARPYDPEWTRDLIAHGAANGYAVFVKQMGANPVGLRLRDAAGAEPMEWPDDLRVRDFPRGH